jgi:lipoate-protein ligase A
MRGKNDIVVNGRKIAGLGLCRGEKGSLLFHASLLVDLDISLMLRVLKISPEKRSNKLQSAIEDNLTTVRLETGQQVAMAEVRNAIRPGFEAAMDVSFATRPFAFREREEIVVLERAKYANDEWILERSSRPARSGHYLQKTPGGLLRIYVSLVEDAIDRIRVTGDFFADGEFVRALEGKISGLRAADDVVRRAIRQFFAATSDSMIGIGEEDVARAVSAALEQAKQSESERAPYACFGAANRG